MRFTENNRLGVNDSLVVNTPKKSYGKLHLLTPRSGTVFLFTTLLHCTAQPQPVFTGRREQKTKTQA